MTLYSFRVDDKLNLIAHEGDGAAFSELPLGVPYYEYYPRLGYKSVDAVAYAIEHGEPLSLAGYRLFCFHREKCTADIEIIPQFAGECRCCGAMIAVDIRSGCSVLGEMENAQALVDIGKISVTLAHGVRNPLNAIKGAVVYLKDKYGTDATFGEFAGIIDDEIHKLDNFITMFLSTSYLDARCEEIQLNDLLERVANLVTLQAQACQVLFKVEYGDLPVIRLDSFNIGHAILNVVNNALGAMESGGMLTLRSRREQDGEAEVAVVEIADTGPGIDYRGTKNIGGFPAAGCRKLGRGYGLFITGEIIRHHRGKLEIIGNPHGGTTVRIVLPVIPPGEMTQGE
ncbi:two-component sensor histidine kinase [Geotalea uraniireducens]|uniref:histidine kinase n=1 Tax=Geotalea uraniireducens TaxID=351604 RepID=A0ABM8ELX6_9BACT|nr:ATP-binding protein [Geotalea uraniireducens]BDV43022.1 two-component sensor histidine kinase [Geotalea uraniireducens]